MLNAVVASMVVGAGSTAWGSDPSLSFGLELSSLYYNRGENVFGRTAGNEQHALLAPSVTLATESGVWVGYWAGYQVTGSNRSALVAEGAGHEQQLNLGYGMGERLRFEAGLSIATFPFAEASRAGARFPVFIEPSLALSRAVAGLGRVSIAALYSLGVQSGFADDQYAYVWSEFGRAIELSSGFAVQLALRVGGKAFPRGLAWRDNTLDAGTDLGFRVSVGDGFDIVPRVHLAWSNLVDRPVADEFLVWASVQLEATL